MLHLRAENTPPPISFFFPSRNLAPRPYFFPSDEPNPNLPVCRRVAVAASPSPRPCPRRRIHSLPDPPPAKYDFVVRPTIEGQVLNFYVLKRPGVDLLLEEIGKKFEIVVFTAGLKAYASLVLDRLDSKGLILHRLYRDSCKQKEGKLVKDLSELGRDLRRVVIVDDNPNAYELQPENALPVAPFVDDLGDRELQKVVEFFEFADCFDDLRDAVAQFVPRTSDASS